MQAALGAADDRKQRALKVLRGEPLAPAARTVTGPLLMGIKTGAKFLGVSRATLWRAVCAGRIQKVELFPGSYRVRREDLEALASARRDSAGRAVNSGESFHHEGSKGTKILVQGSGERPRPAAAATGDGGSGGPALP